MSNFLQSIENISKKIPGYGGYLEREKMRDSDKKLREYISKKLNSIKQDVFSMKSEMLQKGIISYLSQLDNVSSIIDRLANSVLYASRGYGGLFGDNKVYEPELEKLHTFDINFLDSMESLDEKIKNIWKTEEKDFQTKINELRIIVTDLESIWKERDNVLCSFK